MTQYAIFMFIFAIMILVFGICFYYGHVSKILFYKIYYRNLSKSDYRYLGKIVMIMSISPILSALCALLFKQDSLIPFFVLIISLISCLILSIKYIKK